MSSIPPKSEATSFFDSPAFQIVFTTTAFCLGLRWLMITWFGVDVPFWDQWDSPLPDILQPVARGNFQLSALFGQHNEHCPVTCRLISLSLFKLSGEWHPLLEMYFNAALTAILTGLTSWILTQVLDPKKHIIFAFILPVLAFSGPATYQNMLWSFQGPFYIYSICAFFSFWIATQSQESWLGLALVCAATMLAQFGLSSGVLIAGLVAIHDAFVGVTEKDKTLGLRAILLLVFAALLYKLTHFHVPRHDELFTHSVSAFFTSCYYCLSWPNKPFVGIGFFLIYLPVLIIAIKNRRLPTANERFFLLILLSSAATSAAFAFARGGAGSGPAPRHYDLLIPSLIGAVGYLLLQLENHATKSILNRALTVLVLALILLFTIRNVRDIKWLERTHKRRQKMANTVQKAQTALNHFRVLDAIRTLKSAKPAVDSPYPDAEKLFKRLDSKPTVYQASTRLDRDPEFLEWCEFAAWALLLCSLFGGIEFLFPKKSTL